MLEDSVLTVRSANHRFTVWGQSGGGAPRASRVVLNPGTARTARSSGRSRRAHLKAGDVIRFERSGGAGYGPPAERDAEARARRRARRLCQPRRRPRSIRQSFDSFVFSLIIGFDFREFLF